MQDSRAFGICHLRKPLVSYTFSASCILLSACEWRGWGSAPIRVVEPSSSVSAPGKIYTSPVKQPQAWGLPPHIKQKVVWLCGKCATSHKVVFDQQRCQVLVINHERVHKRSA